MSSPSDSSGDLRFHRITSVSIVGGFLEGQRFDLADGLNCIIGARGTGKTTVLEFVRFAMNAMPGDAAARKRIESLVASNLAGGRVEVAVETRDGLSYIVSRSAGDETMVLTTDRSPTDIDLRSGGLFRVDIYSQNEVEAIADRASSQLDLIDNFEAERITAIEHRIRALQADLNGNASKITPLQQKADAIAEELNTLPGLDEKLKAFKEEGGPARPRDPPLTGRSRRSPSSPARWSSRRRGSSCAKSRSAGTLTAG